MINSYFTLWAVLSTAQCEGLGSGDWGVDWGLSEGRVGVEIGGQVRVGQGGIRC